MTRPLVRNQLSALLAALEGDLRDLIRMHLLGVETEEKLLGRAYQEARRRLENDPESLAAGSDIFDNLELGEAIWTVARFRKHLPRQVRDAIDAGRKRLEDLIPIRNRVAHNKPLAPDDHEKVRRWLSDLDDGGFSGQRLRVAIATLRADPAWSPTTNYSWEGSTSHNLQLGDFDETGLIGRQRLVEQVLDHLIRPRLQVPVITLVGEGGIGKTALALEVLHRLASDPESPYEAIAWVSLKTERLTATGVREIRDAVRSIEQAVPILADPLAKDFQGGVIELAALLEGVNALIAIDNLETVSGAEVVELVETLPATVKYLCTSRVGIGELERRIPVGPLDLDFAIELFESLCRAYQVNHLLGLSRDTLEQIQVVVGRRPLDIKWFVMCAAAGQSFETIMQHRADLLLFCVRNVYQGLSGHAKDVAGVLALVDRLQAVSDLKLFLPHIGPDELRAATQELLVRSLCTRSMGDDLIDRFQATEVLVDYLKSVGADSEDLRLRVQRTSDEHRQAEERLRAEQARTPLRFNVISGADAHRGSALRLRDALNLSKRGDFTDALRVITDVEQLDPEFWELFRVRGFILSQQGRVDEATRAYERAVELAPDESEAARVRFFYAGHLVRRVRDASNAVTQARIAHTILHRPESALELGKALTYVRQFPEAIEMLEFAGTTDDVRGRVIAVTQMASTLRRRAEVEASELRSPTAAVDTLLGGIEHGSRLLASGTGDARLVDEVYRCLAGALRATGRLPVDQRDGRLRRVLAAMPPVPLANALEAGKHVIAAARRLAASPGLPADLVQRLTALTTEAAGGSSSTDLMGTVKAWKADRRFGFIVASDGSGDYFFHASDLEHASDEERMARGLVVHFAADANEGRPRATGVRPTNGSAK